MNREEVITYIKECFGVEGESLWAKFPNYRVFRNARNRKWFGLVGDVERGKLGLSGEGKVDLLVIRCDPLMVGSLVQTGGAYLPAYHMNKKNWVSVLLDDSADSEEVKNLIALAFEIINQSK